MKTFKDDQMELWEDSRKSTAFWAAAYWVTVVLAVLAVCVLCTPRDAKAATLVNPVIIGGQADFGVLKVGGVAVNSVVMGTGVATFLATPSSTNFAAAVTGETGSGALVFATSPTLVTPVLGVATLTSANGNTIPSGTAAIYGSLPATTSSIGGGVLTAGSCASGTVAVTGSTTSMTVSISPNTYPGDGSAWYGYVSTNGTVTVKVCAIVALTPTASTYNVRVIQ